MAQKIHQGNIFGRIGSGIGRGLAEQLPKEIERGRLSSGLKELEGQRDLSPFQQFSRLAAIPGITPQMIQSGSELLRQQGIAEGFKKVPPSSDKSSSLDQYRKGSKESASPTRDVATVEPTQAALNPALPLTRNQLLSRASELMQENPQLYPTPDLAYQGALSENQQDIALSNALQGQRGSQQDVQNNIRNQLRGLQSAANAKVPDDVYQKIENKAFADVAKGKKTELDAAKDARDELDKLSRDYKAIDSFGDYTLIGKKPKDVLSGIKSLREKFKKNDDLENFADSLVARSGLSNEYAYSLAYPVPKNINEEIKRIPKITGKTEVIPGTRGMISSKGVKPEDIRNKTLEVIDKIAPMLNKDDSPLAIGHELTKKGYDSSLWRDYLIDNQEKLNLSLRQIRELEKVDSGIQGLLNDWFLQAFGGP